MGEQQKILVVGPSWVGDMIMAQSLYKLLARRKPEAEIHVLAPAWSKPVLDLMPEVSRAIEKPIGHGRLGLRVRRDLGRSLRAQTYTQAIVLPRSLKSALVPFFASIPLRTGFRGESRFGLLNDRRPFDPKLLDQTVKRFVALGLERAETELPKIEAPALQVRDESRLRTLARHELDASVDSVALMPGAEYGPAKRWPLEYFTDLAARLAGVGVSIRVFGSEKERELGEAIVESLDPAQARNLCGETSLVEVADLLSAATVAVTNDSGLMHMAAAVQTHVVALYGSSTPRFTPPLADSSRAFFLDLECSPCFKRECPLNHFRCMREISVDAVCSAVITALGGTTDEPGGDALS
ncbi:MAG: lipopolysaccharide heptosyltransferase II [Candidatus Rariloculaceae bacterium]